MVENINVTRFQNGIVACSDQMPDVRSVTLGVFFRTGSRQEASDVSGITHFIEHTVFKGTHGRSALDIARETDRLGGGLDAFTTHEEMGFAIKVIDDEVDAAFGLIADLVMRPVFDPKELESEQRVIIEEMKMIDDSPEEFLADLFSHSFYPGHPLGRSIAGTPETVKTFDDETTRNFHAKMLSPENLVIVAAGNIDHERLASLTRNAYGELAETREDKPTDGGVPLPAAPIFIRKQTNLEQSHFVLAVPMVGARDEKRYAADLLSAILGGGNSSRLWQEIREERGLAYSVGASTVMYRDSGLFSVYAGTSPQQMGEAVDVAVAAMRQVAADGVTDDELELAKQQARVSILLSLEDSASRASALAQSEMTHGRQISVEETIDKLNAVSLDEVNSIANEFFVTDKVAFGALGDLKGVKIDRDRLLL